MHNRHSPFSILYQKSGFSRSHRRPTKYLTIFLYERFCKSIDRTFYRYWYEREITHNFHDTHNSRNKSAVGWIIADAHTIRHNRPLKTKGKRKKIAAVTKQTEKKIEAEVADEIQLFATILRARRGEWIHLAGSANSKFQESSGR